jgi:hypothetical protein
MNSAILALWAHGFAPSLRVRLVRRLLLIAMLTTSSAVTRAGEDRRFEEQRLQVAERVSSVLAEERVCASRADCRKRNLFFVSPATNGIAIELRTISDPSVIQKLLGESARAYVASGGHMRVTVEFYAEDKMKAVKRSILSREKATLSVIYKEND